MQSSSFVGAASPAEIVFISVGNPMNSRLIESAAVQLGLQPLMVAPDKLLQVAGTVDAAIVVADESVAKQFHKGAKEQYKAGSPPALVAVFSSEEEKAPSHSSHSDLPYNGVLVLPQPPTTIVAQLGVTMYAHRTYIERLETAMELQLDRRIFRSVTSGVSVASATEKDLPLVYVNPAFEAMTGYCLEEIQGKNCRFLQRGDNDQAGVQMLREALKEQREVVAILRNYRKDGTPFWNELSLSPIKDQFGKVTHFVGIQNDVTARVAYEDALRESEKLAACGRLAASIAHEINNPLATVTNLIYLARHENENKERDYFLDLAAEEMNRIALLTTQSLTFYRQSSNPTLANASNLLSEVTAVYATKMSNMNVTVERKDKASKLISCMESELRQVASNFLRNSMEAFEGNEGKILLRVREGKAWLSSSLGVVITFADTGCGMTPKTKASLYTAFHTTKREQGTGIGMWVSKGIIDRHKGRISVKSRQGKFSGTVIRLFLPYGRDLPATAEENETAIGELC